MNVKNFWHDFGINELKQKGDLGDQIWETFIYQETLSTENGKLIRGMNDEAIDFGKKRESLVPHTIDDAIKYGSFLE